MATPRTVTRAHPSPMPTLVDALVPPRPTREVFAALRSAGLIVGGALLTALAAQLSFTTPWTPVPYTGQTAAVLLVGTALGAPLGAASMALYVLAGSLGAPVYAGGESGVDKLIGPTAGYLLGFVLAAGLVGRLAQRGWDRGPARSGALMALGSLVIYAVGVPALSVTTGMPLTDAVLLGAVVFLPWDAAKTLAAAALLPLAWRLVGRRAAREAGSLSR